VNHRSTASFGKRQEYIAVAELLRRNYDVYMSLVDDQQIACVVRQEGWENCVTTTFRSRRVQSETASVLPPLHSLKIGVGSLEGFAALSAMYLFADSTFSKSKPTPLIKTTIGWLARREATGYIQLP